MRFINPTFYEDMQKVFQSEKSPEESKRYVYKLKNLEDTSIKSPTSSNKVEEDFKYELTKMKQLKSILRFKNFFKKNKNTK